MGQQSEPAAYTHTLTQYSTMDNRIGLELRGKKKSEVTQLDLSGCNTGGEIVGLTEEFSALEQLDLQNASLTNIKLFPKLQNLKKLDLSGNRLSKGLEGLKDCPSLKSLSLSNNKFKEISTLEPLKGGSRRSDISRYIWA